MFEIFKVVGRVVYEGHDKVEQQLEKTSSRLDDVGQSFQAVGRRSADFGKSLTKMVTVPLTALGGTILGLALNTSKLGDEMAKAGRRVGMTGREFHALEYALGQTGMSTSEVEMGFRMMNDTLSRSAEGINKQSMMLDRLGISQADIIEGTLSTEEAFFTIIQSLHEMDNQFERNRIATEIFGSRVASKLNPAIADGGMNLQELIEYAKEAGIVMSDEAYDGAEEFTDAMDTLKREFQGATHEIGMEFIEIIQETFIPLIRDSVLPMLLSFTERLAKLARWFNELSPEMQRNIIVVAGLAAALGPVLLIMGQVIMTIGALLPMLKMLGGAVALLSAPITIWIVALGLVVVALVHLYRNVDWFRDGVDRLFGLIVRKIRSDVDSIKTIIEGLIGIVDRAVQAVQRARDAFDTFRGSSSASGSTRLYDDAQTSRADALVAHAKSQHSGILGNASVVINNTFQPPQSTPYEHRVQQERMVKDLGSLI